MGAVDQTSRCEYSVDAATWLPVEAVDGVTDSPREQFRVVIDRLRGGGAPLGGSGLRYRERWAVRGDYAKIIAPVRQNVAIKQERILEHIHSQ